MLSDWLLISGIFLLAGLVKGVIGLGLPTVSLALLTVVFDLPSAMALLLLPSLVTNIWQALAGQHFLRLIQQLKSFFITATVFVFVGALAWHWFDLRWLSGLLGVLLLIYALIGLLGWRLHINESSQVWSGSVLGGLNGILTGMTGSFVVPGVMYLQAIGLKREQLIQAMGILFTLSTLALGLALQNNQWLTTSQLLHSSFAILPALIGMFIGQVIRNKLSENLFKQVFFYALLVLALYIIFQAF